MEPETADYFLRPTGHLNDTGKVGARPRIQVDDRIIGELQRLNPRMPWVNRDSPELDRINEGEKVSSDYPPLFFSAVGFYQLDPDLGRGSLRRLLLVEALAVDPIRKSLQDKGAILHDWQDEVRDARVVAHYVALGVLLLREKDLVQVCDLERLSATEGEGTVAALLLNRCQLLQQ